MTQPVMSSERPGALYTNDVTNGRHHLYADEPAELGGMDIGPTPFEYLSAALASCTSITLRMYANRKSWPVDHIEVEVTHSKVKSESGSLQDVFQRSIKLSGNLDAAQQARMLEIAGKCPVHKTLVAGAEVVTHIQGKS